MKRYLLVTTLAAAVLMGMASTAGAFDPANAEVRKLFFSSVTEDTVNDIATLPLFRGASQGRTVYYVVTESSDKEDARARGVNFAPKLANAAGTGAVQLGTVVDGEIVFPATVDFAPQRVVEPGPTGFPPNRAEPGSVGEAGYSPLIRLPDGTILNAPHVMNATGTHDKLVAIDLEDRTASFQETEGFYNGKEVYYVSFEASDAGAAALEAATYAPALNDAPGQGSSLPTSARSGIIPFVNGMTGSANPERQGLNSALLGEGDPLNIVQSTPRNEKYSPLWDVHLARWSDEAVAQGKNVLQDDFEDVARLAQDGTIVSPSGGPWGASGFIVNCPLISQE